MRASGLVVILAIATLAVFVISTRGGGGNHRHKAPKDTTALAERINTACKPGFKVADWTVGDEFDPLPPGVVQVTCIRVKPPYDIAIVAVAR